MCRIPAGWNRSPRATTGATAPLQERPSHNGDAEAGTIRVDQRCTSPVRWTSPSWRQAARGRAAEDSGDDMRLATLSIVSHAESTGYGDWKNPAICVERGSATLNCSNVANRVEAAIDHLQHMRPDLTLQALQSLAEELRRWGGKENLEEVGGG